MDLQRLAIHTITTKPWGIEQACQEYARREIHGMSVWIEAIEGRSPESVRSLLDDHGMKVPALVRGGFFCDPSANVRLQKIDHNRRLIETAAVIGADMIVLVVGAAPGPTLQIQRGWVTEAIAALLPMAETHGVKLAIEPLHPMYAGDRSCVSTLTQAREICERLDHPLLGVAVDVYHVWWDDRLEDEIKRIGRRNELLAFHLCDWRCPTRDMLNDRTLMGDGCIPLAQIRRWVMDTGFKGWEEVEIFSNEHWATDQGEFLNAIVHRYQALAETPVSAPA